MQCWTCLQTGSPKTQITACIISDVIMQKSVQCAAMLHWDTLVTCACNLYMWCRQWRHYIISRQWRGVFPQNKCDYSLMNILYYWLVMRVTYDMLDLKTKGSPMLKAEGNILSLGPTYHMLPESPVNNCFVIP